MSNVQQLYAGGVTPAVKLATEVLDSEITAALRNAYDQGVPYGIVVAILQGHLFQATKSMVEDN